MTDRSHLFSLPRRRYLTITEEVLSDDEIVDLPPPPTNSVPGQPQGFRISLPPRRHQNPPPVSGFNPPPSSGHCNLAPAVREMLPPGIRRDPTPDGSGEGSHELSDIRFWLWTRLVSATGSAIDGSSHVFRLRLKPNLTARLLGVVVNLLPRAAQSWVKIRWPEWFLPRTVILKKRKEGWDEEFENEKRMYAGLRELQGTVIPICYGLVVCGKQPVPALVPSDIGGYELCQPQAGAIPEDQLAKLLRDAFEALARCGVGHGDLKLDNLHLTRNNGLRAMVVDLESVEDVNPANSAFFVDSNIDHVLRIYRNHQECLIDDGFLPTQQVNYID
ncbi:hypothetical protein MFIFM68171_10547 [Madurella fahalii]|uniref:Protein kinase domain-containing protein n=1 Tax=Madurella fahalii TaxID=1157608 RepID=A0ABQ0GRJ5_9PEZI